MPTPITLEALAQRYDAILLDSYGVLVAAGGALPGARALLDTLERANKPYYILTNDASRLPSTLAKRFASFGLPIDISRIITSGSLLVDYFAAEGLRGKRCMVLGTADSRVYAEEAGAQLVDIADDAECEVLVVCDDDGYDFLPGVEAATTMVMRNLRAHKSIHLVLCNPDIIYPKGNDAYGFTSGAVAHMIEAALAVRFTGHPRCPSFVRLGKPYAPIFTSAIKRCGSRNVVLIGDQLATDIRGAHDFGIDSVLVGTGLTDLEDPELVLDPEPTYLLR